MDNQKTIIVLLCVIIAILVVGIVMFSPFMAKEDSSLAIVHKKVNVGDSLVVKLTDVNGNPISDEAIHIKLTDKNGNVIDESKTTNSKGKAKLKMDEKGMYSVECSFDGNDKFKSSSTSGDVSVKNAVTSEVTGVDSSSKSSPSDNRLSVDLPNFDEKVRKTSGEYTLEAEKWRGGSVGGFGVTLYKNGQAMDINSYQSRAYFYMDGEWKWSDWGNGQGSSGYHKYPVSDGVEIKEVEVRIFD